MQEYVLGIAVSNANVVLIEKNRPAWQKGQLNFPGGKVEKLPPVLYESNGITWQSLERSEPPDVAMRREFLEETGVDIANWTMIGSIKGKDYHVCLMYVNSNEIDRVETTTDEEVLLLDIDEVINGDYDILGKKFVHNTKLLLQFAVVEWARNGAKIHLEYP